jgi:hypothetical protein
MWEITTAMSKTDIKNIKYWVVLHVVNPQTLAILARALDGQSPGPYPGKRFWGGDERAKAIIGLSISPLPYIS